MRSALLLALLVGCVPPEDRGGTAVGNPGNLDVAVSGEPEGLTLDAAELRVETLQLFDCDGSFHEVPLNRTLDALSMSDPVDVPGGTWCGATLWLDLGARKGSVYLEGETDKGTLFQAPLLVAEIKLAARFVVDGNALLVGVPLHQLLDADFIDSQTPNNRGFVEIMDSGPDDTGAIQEDAAVEAGGVWEDFDLNGVIDVDDRLVGTIDDGMNEAASDDAGCSCATPAGPVSAVWLAIVAMIVRRHRGESDLP